VAGQSGAQEKFGLELVWAIRFKKNTYLSTFFCTFATMKVVNYTDLRLNLKHWLDTVINDVEEIIIKRKNNKDLVLISLDEYNSLKETSYLLSGKNRDILMKSIDEYKKGEVEQHDLLEE